MRTETTPSSSSGGSGPGRSGGLEWVRAAERVAERVLWVKRVPRWAWLAASAVVLLSSSYVAYRELESFPFPGEPDYFHDSVLRESWFWSPLVIGSGRELPDIVGVLNGIAIQPASSVPSAERGHPLRGWIAGNRGLLAHSEDHGRCWTGLEYVSDPRMPGFGGFRLPSEDPCAGAEAGPAVAASGPGFSTSVYAAEPEASAASEQQKKLPEDQSRPSEQRSTPQQDQEVPTSLLLITPGRVTFPDTLVGTTAGPQPVEVANPSKQRAAILAAGIEDPAGEFSGKTNCDGLALEPGDSCSFKVSFTPRSAGPRKAILYVKYVTAGLSETRQVIVVEGTGVPAPKGKGGEPTSSKEARSKPARETNEKKAPPPSPLTSISFTPPSGPPSLLAVEFTDAEVGLAVAENGTIFRTSDGGDSWKVDPQRDGSRYTLRRAGTGGGAWEFAFFRRGGGVGWANGTELNRFEAGLPAIALPSCGACNVRSYEVRDGVGWALAWQNESPGDRNLLFRRDAEGVWWPASRAALPEEERRRLDEAERGGRLSAGYWRLPPPWYLATLLLCILLAVPALLKPAPVARPEEGEEAPGVEGVLASDKPLEPGDHDALGLKTIALGLSRFLRNEKTLPPLTIAVNGEWGTGKSSLMNLLRRDLESYGFRPVWFNAWHHQKEEHLLAALLQTVRLEGVPPIWQLHGVPFRVKLLWYRLRSNLPGLVLLTAGLFFLVSLESRLAEGGDSFLAWLLDVVGDVLSGGAPAGARVDPSIHQHGWLSGPWLSRLMALAAVLRAFWNGVRAFGANPAALLTTVSGGRKAGDLEAQTSFRQRFAVEFRQVTQALNPRRPLVVFVDDLDRCTPGNILAVLESVNFLVTSGDCFVVMGLARRPVEGAVAYSLKDIATWVRQEQDKGARRAPGPVDATEYARQYLDKLINIEVPVPKPKEGDQAKDLFVPKRKEAAEPAAERYLRRSLRVMQVSVPVVLVGMLLWGVLPAAAALSGPLREMMARVNASRTGTPANGLPASGTLVPAPAGERQAAATESGAPEPTQSGGELASLSGQGSAPAAVESGPLPEIRLGRDVRLPDWALLSPSYLIVVFLLLALQVVLTTRPGVQTRDSDSFSAALEVWYPLVLAKQGTPRAAKRFVNRVRFLAMRQGVGRTRTPLWERVLFPERLEAGPDPAFAASDGKPGRIPESLLVPLAAMELVDSDWVHHDDRFKESIGSDSGPSKEDIPGTRALFLKAREMHRQKETLAPWEKLSSHRTRFLELWPQVTVR